MTINFTSTPNCSGISTVIQTQSSSVVVSTITPDSWQHVSITIDYCAGNPSSYIQLVGPILTAFNAVVIDNVSLTEVVVPNNMSVSIGALPSTVCSGNPSVLTATPTNFICSPTYTWTPGNLTGQSVTVNPVSTTTYTVSATNGCQSASSTSVVTVSVPIINVSPSSPFIILGNPVTLTASGGNTYSWTPATSLNTSVGSTVIATPTVTTTYTVTGTDIYGCIASTTVVVTVLPPCGGCGQQMPAMITSSQTYNTASTGNGILCVNNDVIIDGAGTNVVMDGINVHMTGVNGTGVRIHVRNGARLFIVNNAKVYSCNSYLWDGIYIDDGASEVDVINSKVEDARHAIVSINGGKYICNNSVFNKNYKSIEVLPFAGTHSGTIMGCNFESTSSPATSGPLNTLKIPFAGKKPSVGVQITDVQNITIGSTSSALTNTFKFLEKGIHVVKNTNVTIINNQFRDITYTTYCPPLLSCPNTGIAVLVENNSTMVVGGSSTLSNLFKNCTNGIIARNDVNSDVQYNKFENINAYLPAIPSACILFDINSGKTLTASNNTMQDIRCGVQVRKYDNCFVFINNNNMKRFQTGDGVLCLQNTSSTVQVYSNVFNTNAPTDRGKTAIRIQNAVVTSTGFVDVETNSIKGCRIGLRMSFITRPQISNQNDVRMFYTAPPTSAEYGFWIDRCAGMTVNDNTVHKDPNNVLPTSYSGLVNGFVFDQGCILSGILDNHATRLATGFRFSGVNNTPLFFSCNFMVNNRIGMALMSTDIGDQGTSVQAQDNQWAIPSGLLGATNNTTNSPNFYTRSLAHPWFPDMNSEMNSPGSILSNNTTFSVPNSPYYCLYICIGCQQHQNQLAKFAQHQNPYSNMQANDKYVSSQAIYAMLREDTMLLHFGNPNDSVLTIFRDSIAGTNIGLARGMGEDFAIGDTTSAFQKLQIFVPSGLMEQNRKIVNEIYFRTWAKNIWYFTPQDSSTLFSIAYQMADDGGTAVLDARVMLQYDQDDYLSTSSSRVSQPTNQHHGDNLGTMYPNPATDKATYEITLEENETGDFILFDLFGQKLRLVKLINAENKVELDLTDLASGVYFYRVFINGEAKASDILVISK